MNRFRAELPRRSPILLVAALALAACSSGSSSQPLTADSFGAKYKFAANEVSGWSQTTDPTDLFPYGVFTDANLDQRIDGGNMAYVSRGMTLAMYQDLVGPNGGLCTIVAMSFGTDANATTMFDFEKTQSGATDAVGAYDTATVIGESLITGMTAYAHFKAAYFEVQIDGISDKTAAGQAAGQFVKILETKTK